MASYGEIKWAALISRPATFLSITRRATTVELLFLLGNSIIWFSKPEDVNSFVLKPVNFIVNDKRYLKPILRFMRYIPGYVPFSFDLTLTWFPVYRELPSKALLARYRYLPERIFVRIPADDLSDPSEWVDIPISGPRPNWPSFPGAKILPPTHKVPSRFQKDLTPSSLANLALANYRNRRLLPNQRPSVPGVSSSKKPTGVIYASFVNASERSNVPYAETAPTQYVTYQRLVTGTTTPGFSKLKKKGQLPINPVSITITKLKDSQAYRKENHVGTFDQFGNPFWISRWTGTSGFLADESGHLPYSHKDLKNQTIKKLINGSGLGTNINIGQDIIQWRQLDKLIGGNTKKIAKSLTLLRQGRYPESVDVLWNGIRGSKIKKPKPKSSVSLANNWLEMQYGWKILLMEIRNSMRMLANNTVNNRMIRYQSAKETFEEVNRYPNRSGQSTALLYKDKYINGNVECYRKTICKFGIRFSLSNQALSYASQLGLTNPLSLAWELLPFSFVYDWVHPIGDYLDGLTAFQGWSFLDGFCSQLTQVKNICEINYNGKFDAANRVGREVGRYSVEWTHFTREKLTSFPSQTFPSFENPFSFTHTANGIALLRLAVRGRAV